MSSFIKQQSPFFALLFVNILTLLYWRRDLARLDLATAQVDDFADTQDGSNYNIQRYDSHHRHQHIADGMAVRNSSMTDAETDLKAVEKAAIHAATASCEVCIVTPEDPLCEYGLDNIHLSRTYEGSGTRVRQMLAKAEAGGNIRIGIIGGSVSAGRGVVGRDKWSQRFFKQLKRDFPQSTFELFDGAVPAMGSQFFGYCYDALMPSDLDLYVIEMDINNESHFETIVHDDTLFRALLGLPQQPAVIRVAVVATSFPTMMLGSVSSGLNSQWFDVPVISLRNWLLPHFFASPKKMAEFFSGMPDDASVIDYRHMSWVAHNAISDMLILYLREQTCEMKRRKMMTLPSAKGRWPKETQLGQLPRLSVWEPWSEDKQPVPVTPSCAFSGSPRKPLEAAKDLTDPSWHVEEWNGKSALASHVVGARIGFPFKGTRIGVFIYQSMGKGHPEKPGKVGCWVDDKEQDKTILDAWIANGPSGSEMQLVKQDLEYGQHTLMCEILSDTSTEGHEVRFVGVASQ